jgi:hypothetical protein
MNIWHKVTLPDHGLSHIQATNLLSHASTNVSREEELTLLECVEEHIDLGRHHTHQGQLQPQHVALCTNTTQLLSCLDTDVRWIMPTTWIICGTWWQITDHLLGLCVWYRVEDECKFTWLIPLSFSVHYSVGDSMRTFTGWGTTLASMHTLTCSVFFHSSSQKIIISPLNPKFLDGWASPFYSWIPIFQDRSCDMITTLYATSLSFWDVQKKNWFQNVSWQHILGSPQNLQTSPSIGAQYVAKQKKIGWIKVKICSFGSAKWLRGSASFHRMLRLVKGIAEPNIYDRIIGLLVPVCD